MVKAQAQVTQVVYTNEQIVNAATGKWGEVAHDVKPGEPFEIERPDGDPIVIAPLTRRRRKDLKAAQAAYLLVGAQLAEAQNVGDADQSTISRIQGLMEEAEKRYDIALFGSEALCNQVYEMFDELDEAYWEAMYQAAHDVIVNRVDDLPKDTDEDGKTEDGEGKEQSSSTSSTATG